MLYALRGGGVIQSASTGDLIFKLSEQSLFGERSESYDYMVSVAKVCKQVDNADIRFDSEEHFIEDLIKGGFMIEIKEEEISPKKDKFRH